MTNFAGVESLWVRYRSGVVFSVVLTKEDGSTSELRGVAMYALLNELSQRWRRPKTKSGTSSSPTSLDFGRRTDASRLAKTLRGTR